MLQMVTGNRAHGMDQRGFDLHQTPPVAVRALLALEPVPPLVWEPACGPGAIVTELRSAGHEVVASDLVEYGCPGAVPHPVDFLLQRAPPVACETILTNPPFSLAEEFVAHAIAMAPKVYLLLRVGFLEGLRWEQTRDFGAHLRRVHVFTPRLPMMHREGYMGVRNENSGMAFAWYVFERHWLRRTGTLATIDWVDWRDYALPHELTKRRRKVRKKTSYHEAANPRT